MYQQERSAGLIPCDDCRAAFNEEWNKARRERRVNDPAYRDAVNKRQRDVNQARRDTDPAYREARNKAAREYIAQDRDAYNKAARERRARKNQTQKITSILTNLANRLCVDGTTIKSRSARRMINLANGRGS